MKDPRDIVIRPILTEKTLNLKNTANQYVFEVARDANKIEVKHAVEQLFKVRVEKVQIINVKGKIRRVRRAPGRTRSWKKAIVKLKSGDSIPIFEGA
ncbi:MAG: 50S ribosomal protein L23 [Candidatus Hydrothermota bacterium]|uniref:Large ribosomal subunit protein uL23 n=1 Tax=candidate division WOR-3 bacterium TaxID=2052148 RepID=A0A7C1B9J6_UNCW3|nr:50S ribosomal protein L23 [Candidatus Hydrothermae bacterium]RKY95645.1 MAG: 50S ribosomal protein L23 [Candidatus Hydrothermae bacterium]RKZ00936.1 MAG: 50S ribosomal protein L23 [Candidatus Hydrothermae bacterium]HDM89711.1 50S ribosomal protein L23 [candidate division WOR-3 bacterium]